MDKNTQQEDPQPGEAEAVDKIKVKGAASKFFNANPDLLSGIQSDINGREGRLKTLQDRNKFLNDQLGTIERTIKAYNGLYNNDPTKIPPALTDQLQQLSGELQKNSAAYQQEFNNVKPLPPDPTQNSVNLDHNGKSVPVDADLLAAVRKGDPNVLAKISDMSSSNDPQVRDQVAAMAKATGEDMVDQQQQMFRDNGEVSSAPVPSNAMTPTTPAQIANPSVPGRSAADANTNVVSTIANSIGKNPISPVAASGPSGAVEFIRRQMLANLANEKK